MWLSSASHAACGDPRDRGMDPQGSLGWVEALANKLGCLGGGSKDLSSKAFHGVDLLARHLPCEKRREWRTGPLRAQQVRSKEAI